ncbi:alpha/beta fold hydrolase [Actinomyces sp. ZJ308]|uniref:alpha/beta hydrolase n=1 Tax=Actinomyces sp. ZJ308 TaxID=2708342 RepID=UPI001AB029A8|nr:alpha/beta fold hydrolase [Actinomyces sp. ZJ308]
MSPMTRRALGQGLGALAAVQALGMSTASAAQSSPSANPSNSKTGSPNGAKPICISRQGTFQAGGTVQTAPGTFDPVRGQMAEAGQTRHSDHAHVFYQLPQEANKHNVVFLHGYGQSFAGWQSTPDGREGWSDFFLRRGYGVYLVDQPRRGQAGQSSVPAQISATPDDLNWFTQFRMGRWPEFNEGVQIPTDEASMDQFFRQMTPDTGEFDVEVITAALVAVMEKAGPSTLVTHSQGGIPGWYIAARSTNTESVVAIEPGSFLFPEGENPEPIVTDYPGPAGGTAVPLEQFEALTTFPIRIYYGDFIPAEGAAEDLPANQFWRANLKIAREFERVVNAHGGDCEVIVLPEAGIHGNDHFMFQDRNSDEVAEHIHSWLKTKGLS